jgi:cysteinyl-tRNA synthetase
MIRLYNTLSREKEEFKPIRDKKVGMYVCGPTVYGPSHLGHGRTYIAFDVIRRYLEWRGFKVKLISNITDIHDDIIKEAASRGISVSDLASVYSKKFFDDLEKLDIKKADAYPRVTRHIKEIIALIKKLFAKGLAYKAADGSVYFRVAGFKNYGRLSGIKLKKTKTGTRVETDKYEKTEAADFALWKKENIEGASWPSPWGTGRPGWHIECSAMSAKYLGEQFDIHGGARDLIFPHHENEIAQAEGATGKSPFVKYWLHSGLLTVDGQKMSKSLKNYIELKQIFQNYEPRVLRFLILATHYRSPLDFSYFAMTQAKNGLSRIDEFLSKLETLPEKTGNDAKPAEIKNLIKNAEDKFIKEMDDDFNTPKAVAAVFNLIKKVNKIIAENKLTRKDAAGIIKFFKEIDKVFAILPSGKTKIPDEIKKLAQKREQARAAKKWNEADRLRAEIEKSGYKVEDTPQGPKISKT